MGRTLMDHKAARRIAAAAKDRPQSLSAQSDFPERAADAADRNYYDDYEYYDDDDDDE